MKCHCIVEVALLCILLLKCLNMARKTSGTRQAVCDVFIIEYHSHG